MHQCSFELNGQPMSVFKIGAHAFPAFSGDRTHANKRSYMCSPGIGPIPAGNYYIFDRQSGGLFGPLREMFNDRGMWFALYAVDSKIDDETLCNKIKRGCFRLHPKGRLGASKGCITIESHTEFLALHGMLKGTTPISVPGTNLKAYGKVTVR